MSKSKKLTNIIVATAAAATITTVGTTLTQTSPIQSVAKAATKIAADGPWKTTGDAANLPELQQLHNGNQIYYSIAPNDKNNNLFQQSVQNWNDLGVIDLVQVPWGSSDSQIQMSTSNSYSPDGDEDGQTHNSYEYAPNDTIATMFNTTITLYKDLDSDSAINKQVTADHELGHALGFAHDNRKLKNGKEYKNYRLTMYWNVGKHTYRLGGIEQRTLSDHYGIKPTTWLNTNC